MIEVLLKGMKMDPLVSMHYYAPVSIDLIRWECFIYRRPRGLGLRGDQSLGTPFHRRLSTLP